MSDQPHTPKVFPGPELGEEQPYVFYFIDCYDQI